MIRHRSGQAKVEEHSEKLLELTLFKYFNLPRNSNHNIPKSFTIATR